jgi:hypothetical protein
MKRGIASVVFGLCLATSLVAQSYVIPGRPRAAAAFSPSDVSGLVLWLETDSGVSTDANGVYDWDDQSSSDNDLVQATDSLKPDVVTDHFATNYDGIQGDDSDDAMTLQSEISDTGDISVFVVMQAESNQFEPVYGSPTGPGASVQFTNGEKARFRYGTTTYTDCTGNGAFTAGEEILFEFHRDSSDNVTCFFDGTDQTSGSPTETDTIYISQFFAIRGNATGHIYGAMLIYDNKVSSGDAASIRTYLNDKYTLY